MIILSLFCLILSSSVVCYGNASIEYINAYSHIAIAEMQHSGIPASIKMAQALLESGAGKSTLAQKANNHFGIKCGGGWNGETFYREDDDYHNGKLIESCFRKFSHAEESYSAHTDFLMNQPRYAFLFDYDKKDYHAWANGLRKAGYATDKAYPKKLINIIEKYKLYDLDNGQPDEMMYVAAETTSQDKNEVTPRRSRNKDSFSLKKSSKSKKRNSKRSKKSKSKKRSSSSEYHIVEAKESIADIAKAYRIKESSLRIRNRLPKDAEPLQGEKIYLRNKISLLQRPEFIRVAEGNSIASSDYIF